jgi:hypothetical protein
MITSLTEQYTSSGENIPMIGRFFASFSNPWMLEATLLQDEVGKHGLAECLPIVPELVGAKGWSRGGCLQGIGRRHGQR